MAQVAREAPATGMAKRVVLEETARVEEMAAPVDPVAQAVAAVAVRAAPSN